MSALVLEIAPRAGFSPEWVRRVLAGGLAGALVPAHVVGDAAVAGRELLETEAVVPEVLATRYAGDARAADVARAVDLARGAPVVAWCAVPCGLPRPGGGVLEDAWLRFAVGLGTARERLVPLVSLRIADGVITVRFGMHGAPVIAPASRDRGGPIDQAWARASEAARASLGRALDRLRASGEVELSLEGEGMDPAVAGAEWDVPFTLGNAPILAIPAAAPGPCKACRHANQGTEDLDREGLLACAFIGPRPLHRDPQCEVPWTIDQKRWFAFEPYDGGNCTWGLARELRVRVPRKK